MTDSAGDIFQDLVVLDEGPMCFAQIDPVHSAARVALRARYGSADECMFRLVTVPLELVPPQTFDLKEYLSDGTEEGRARYKIACRYREAFLNGRDVPPIIGRRIAGVYQVLDGTHRVVAAHAAGIAHIRAWDLLDPERPQLAEDLTIEELIDLKPTLPADLRLTQSSHTETLEDADANDHP